jgi:hypothetical protein
MLLLLLILLDELHRFGQHILNLVLGLGYLDFGNVEDQEEGLVTWL